MKHRLKKAQAFVWALWLIFRVWRESRKHGVSFLLLLSSVQYELDQQVAALDQLRHEEDCIASRVGDVN